MLSQVVLPFVATGTVTATWGNRPQSYQVLELSIYKTKESWNKKNGPISDIIRNKKNVFEKFRTDAQRLLAKDKRKIFVVTPIQGSKHGDQEQQRILREFDDRFEVIESISAKHDSIAVRIDREAPLEDIVARIKKEIRVATFVIADLTDERPSCYFEAGFAEALGKPVIYVASKNSVLRPGVPTKIHFDIHMNVLFFTNHQELREKLEATIEKNKTKLFPSEDFAKIEI